MALRPVYCDRLMQLAEREKRQILVGHVLPLLPEYAFARQAIGMDLGRRKGLSFALGCELRVQLEQRLSAFAGGSLISGDHHALDEGTLGQAHEGVGHEVDGEPMPLGHAHRLVLNGAGIGVYVDCGGHSGQSPGPFR